MALSKSFLSQQDRPRQESKVLLFKGLIIGMLYAISFYGFLYCLREILRAFSITEFNDIWILSKDEVAFYNLFFAFLSSILGQSICFSIWFERPRKVFQKKYRRTVTILVDHKVLIWFFLAWFSKLAVVYALFFTGSYTNPDFYVFSFYPKYNYLFIIIVLVLFLQAWTGFLLKFKRDGFKWMAVSAIVISSFSFLLSKIDVLNYEALNKRVLDKNIYERYNISLPVSDHYMVMNRRDRFEQIYMVQPDNTVASEPIFMINQGQFRHTELASQILEQMYCRPSELRHEMIFQLNIQSNIKIAYVELLKEELANLNIRNLDFAVVPQNSELNSKYYKNHYLSVINPGYYDISKIDFNRYNILTIETHESGTFFLNGRKVRAQNLRNGIIDFIKNNPNYALKPIITEQLTFETYFFLIQNTTAAILDTRDFHSEKLFGVTFNKLDQSDKKEIVEMYPMRVMEVKKEKFPLLENLKKNRPPRLPYLQKFSE